MRIALTSHGAPVSTPRLQSLLPYLSNFAQSTKNFFIHIAKVICPCDHSHNLTMPVAGIQACPDCGAWRDYILGEKRCEGDEPLWIGRWQDASKPLPRDVAWRSTGGLARRLVASAASKSNSGDRFCCVGVDYPGLGFVHGADCPFTPDAVSRFGEQSLQPGGDPRPGEVPPSLRRMLREDLVVNAIFAAEDLVHSRIVYLDEGGNRGMALRCLECEAVMRDYSTLFHKPGCLVDRLSQQLEALASAPVEKVAVCQ